MSIFSSYISLAEARNPSIPWIAFSPTSSVPAPRCGLFSPASRTQGCARLEPSMGSPVITFETTARTTRAEAWSVTLWDLMEALWWISMDNMVDIWEIYGWWLICLVGGFPGTWLAYFPLWLGDVIIPIDELICLTNMFQKGRSTTNQNS